MLTTVRSKLLAILLLFVVVTVTTSLVVFNYFEKNKDALSSITQKAENAHIFLLKDIKITRNFFENETINPAFFESGKSRLIERHRQTCLKIDKTLSELYAAQQQNNFNLNDRIKNLKVNFANYKYLTDALFKQILVRGFKDYGIEGKMRIYAHDLENFSNEIGLVNVLQLRRHEKDYIIRQEEPYVLKHNHLVADIKSQILENKTLSTDKKIAILGLLENYSVQFNRLVAYEKKLGLKSGTGLKRQIDVYSDKIEMALSALVNYSAVQEQAALVTSRWIFISIGLAFMLISIVSAIIISKTISRSITQLKENIDEFVKSDFTVRPVLPLRKSASEIDVLTANFGIMEQHIVNQVNSLRQTNKDLEMLFYATSNDIRFPLLEVKTLTEDAELAAGDARTKEVFEKINRSWERLLSIVDELGIITNIRNVEINTEKINLEELIRAVYSEFRSLPGFDNIIFSLNLSARQTFVSSPGLIKAIFRNLIENGIKYAARRGSLSFLKITLTDQNEGMIRIEVADNGIGIKPEHQEKIFDMFFRGTSYASGTGLGLYIVKCSIDKLHGSIQVESEEGKGTTFKLLIPNNYTPKNIREHILHNHELSEITQGLTV